MTTPPARRPTLRDVALQAGVSFKTVSRVANGEDGVSEELAKRVEAAIASLGYRPDDRARHLRRTDSSSGAIGFVLVDVANPFFSSILRGIEDVARKMGSLVLSGSSDGDPLRQDQLIQAFIDRRVDGLIVVPVGGQSSALEQEIERGTPVVYLDLEPANVNADLVRSDHFGGAARATQHLLDNGHRDIAFFGDSPEIFSGGERLRGFQATMRDAQLPPRIDRVVTGHYEPGEWFDLALRYLSNNEQPTAILSAQNFVTVGVTQALHQLGLQDRIAQVGFDDVDLAAVVTPGITVVPQYPSDLGRRAAETLFDRIDNPTRPLVREITASPIIVRGSGEIPPDRPASPPTPAATSH
jgi:LacI family transcriptional regulator